MQQSAQAEIDRITDPNHNLTLAELDAYPKLLQMAIYPDDIEERTIREDDPKWGGVRR